jgi:flagellar basal body-associated protein FliL
MSDHHQQEPTAETGTVVEEHFKDSEEAPETDNTMFKESVERAEEEVEVISADSASLENEYAETEQAETQAEPTGAEEEQVINQENYDGQDGAAEATVTEDQGIPDAAGSSQSDEDVEKQQQTEEEAGAEAVSGSSTKIILLVVFGLLFLGFSSYLVYSKFSERLGGADQPVVDPNGAQPVPVPVQANTEPAKPLLPTITPTTTIPVVSKPSSLRSAAPLIILSTVAVLLIAGLAVGGYFFYTHISGGQIGIDEELGRLGAEVDKKSKEIESLKSTLKEVQDKLKGLRGGQ